MQQVVLASSNQGKLREFSDLLSGQGLQILTQSEFDISDAEETGLTFVENAIIKARHAALATGLAAIADDSGLEVDALNGAPGIYSARFAEMHQREAGDSSNNQLLLEKLKDTPDDQRGARFRSVIVLMRHPGDSSPVIAQGIWEGRILHEASGSNGFGYDPLFYVPQMQCSSATLDKEVKNRLSHRGRALQLLLEEMRKAGFPAGVNTGAGSDRSAIDNIANQQN